jgi:hypothetical protein
MIIFRHLDSGDISATNTGERVIIAFVQYDGNTAVAFVLQYAAYWFVCVD